MTLNITEERQLKTPELSVLTIGAGKAGMDLHAGVWHANGIPQFVYDSNPAKMDISQKSPKTQELFTAGQFTMVSSLEEITVAPPILDIVTSSGRHLEGLREGLSVYADLGQEPLAVLLEKPVVNQDEMAEFDELLAAWGIEPKTVVNENYLASSGLAALLKLGEDKAAQGIVPEEVFVSFDKDRVPDVLAGRFTDPVLGAYGIEMPHMASVALALAGVAHGNGLTIRKNEYRRNVNGVTHSEATYTHGVTSKGVEVLMAQGLGPFRMDRLGNTHAQEIGKGIFRFAEVQYSDGSAAKVTFAPAPGAPSYHSVISERDENGKRISDPVDDNSMKRVIEVVIETASTGRRPENAQMLNVDTAKQTVRLLDALRQGATVIDEQ